MRVTLAVLAAAAFASTALASKIYSEDPQIYMSDDYRNNFEIPEDNLLPDECELIRDSCIEYIGKKFKDQIPVVECGQGPDYTALSFSCRGIKINQQTDEFAKLYGYQAWAGKSS